MNASSLSHPCVNDYSFEFELLIVLGPFADAF